MLGHASRSKGVAATPWGRKGRKDMHSARSKAERVCKDRQRSDAARTEATLQGHAQQIVLRRRRLPLPCAADNFV
jgi:hypothetical protein